jgi:hypothetical protein
VDADESCRLQNVVVGKAKENGIDHRKDVKHGEQ